MSTTDLAAAAPAVLVVQGDLPHLTLDDVRRCIDALAADAPAALLVPNDDGRLRPGMFLRVSLLRQDARALVVPEQAIVPERSQQFVFVVDDDGRAEKRPVETGRRRPGEVEIVQGVRAGERVVTEGAHKLRSGDLVRLLDETSAAGGFEGVGR